MMMDTIIFYLAKRAFSKVLEGVASLIFQREIPISPFFNNMSIEQDFLANTFLLIEADA